LEFDLAERLKYLVVLLPSLTVHEFAHAWAAWRLGDDTAARMGRLTLNPIPHIDPVGTLLLPLLGVPIGWAKPVPVNPANFRRGIRMGTGDLLVSIAGPISNLSLALVTAVVFGLVIRFTAGALQPSMVQLFGFFILLNVGLAVFNLLPLPPLDGSHVVGSFIPYRWRDAWDSFQRVGPILLMVLLVAGAVGGRSILWAVIGPPSEFIIDLLYRVAGGLAT
jgi:Zn-dependent protease